MSARARRLVLASLTLCAMASTTPSVAKGAASASGARVEIPEAEILGMNRKMAQFLVETVKPSQVRSARLQALHEALFSDHGLGIEYGNTETRTAAETFARRSGNCLSFTLLFVTMARHLGLSAYFREVEEVTSWDLRGDLLVRNQHMFAEVELDNGVVQVDFLPGVDKRYRNPRRISDRRVLAHFYNNRGAEELAAGEVERAVAYFEKALATDEELVPALVNAGVAYRRQGRFADAEQSLQRALELDASEEAAISNLASLFLTEGRIAEAEPLQRRAEAELRKNPYHHFRLARTAAGAGLLGDALEHLNRAIELLPRQPRFHAELAELQLRAGSAEEARASLRRALELADDTELRERLEARLREVSNRQSP